MAERLAALGLKAPVQVGESAQQKEDRGRKEREERARQAETAENQRKEERQKRLADEAPRPPASQKLIGKKPPPPPSRGTRSGSLHDKQKTQGPTATRRDEKEETLKLEQEKQAAQTRDLEYVQSPSFSLNTYTDIVSEVKLGVKKTSLPKRNRMRKLDSRRWRSSTKLVSSKSRERSVKGRRLKKKHERPSRDWLHSEPS